MRPKGDVYMEYFTRALTAALPVNAEPGLDVDQAEQKVAEAVRTAEAEATSKLALNLVRDSRAAAQEQEAAAAKREADQRRAERHEKLARKAWRKLYGREIAKQLKVQTVYRVLRPSGHAAVFACPEGGRAEAVIAAFQGTGMLLEEIGRRSGMSIGRVTEALTAVDPDPEQAVALVIDEELARRRRDRDREISRRQATEATQEARRQESLYGVAVGNVTDDD